MEIITKAFEELTADELYDILRLRVDIFVVEQGCIYHELDGLDKSCYHVYLRDEEGIQAYLRVIPAGLFFDEAAIGRVLSKKRRIGLATILLNEGIRAAEERLGAKRIMLEAQVYARGLYEKAGFKQCSEEYYEDGILHINMIRIKS